MAPHGGSSNSEPAPDGGTAVLAGLVLVVGVCVLLPALAVVCRAVSGLSSGHVDMAVETPGLALFPVALIATTFLWSGGIGLLSTLLAWPVAWALRGARRAAWAWLLAPMLVPGYLIYAGWGLLRAPRTWLGDYLEQAAQAGHRWAPVLAGQAIAIVGLALWAVPLAALMLWSGLRRIDPSIVDSLRLEAPGRLRRAVSLVAMSAPSIAVAVGVVTLVMLGSAVPLHLAQVPTYAIQVWLALDTTPADQQWKVWVLAWPLLLGAAIAGWLIGARVARADAGAVEGNPPARPPRAAFLAGAAVWGAAVLIPLGLFVQRIADWRSLTRFWQVSGLGAAFSGEIALAVGVLGLFVALAVSVGLSTQPESTRARLTRVCVYLLLVAGLVPGVLVGSAVLGASQMVASAVPRFANLGDSAVIVVVAHLARFGFVPALAGCWLARTEGAAQRWLRRLDGAESLRGWAGAALPTQAGVCISAALATAALSLHEIEASVIVTPPGDSLPRLVLSYLHYLKTEEMCAAAVWIVGLGVLVAALSAWLVGLTESRARPPEKGPGSSPSTEGARAGI